MVFGCAGAQADFLFCENSYGPFWAISFDFHTLSPSDCARHILLRSMFSFPVPVAIEPRYTNMPKVDRRKKTTILSRHERSSSSVSPNRQEGRRGEFGRNRATRPWKPGKQSWSRPRRAVQDVRSDSGCQSPPSGPRIWRRAAEGCGPDQAYISISCSFTNVIVEGGAYATALTLIPLLTSCLLRDLVNPTIAPLVEA
jgi:hypothetical protein